MPPAAEPDLEILEVIVEECLELVIEGRAALQALVQGAGDAAPAHTAALFRVLHTIKGNAGFAQLDHITRAVHAAESVLAAMRDGSLALTADRTYLLLETLDQTELALSLVLDVFDDKAFAPEASALCELLHAECHKAGPVHRPTAPPPPPTQAPKSQERPSATPTVRVVSARLDALLGDLAALETLQHALTQQASTGLVDAAALEPLGELAARIGTRLRSLSEVPVRPMFQKMRRLVRSLGPEIGKRVEVSVTGDEQELDRRLLMPLSECLLHLLRNCVAHGIERPRVRTAAGKAPVGLIRMELIVDAAQVTLRVSDDGSGVDRRAVLARASAQGLIEDQADTLSDGEVLKLIMLPGLSTAEAVTQVAGRGVGMDAVLNQILSLSGSIDVKSEPGQGTCFTLSVPNRVPAE